MVENWVECSSDSVSFVSRLFDVLAKSRLAVEFNSQVFYRILPPFFWFWPFIYTGFISDEIFFPNRMTLGFSAFVDSLQFSTKWQLGSLVSGVDWLHGVFPCLYGRTWCRRQTG